MTGRLYGTGTYARLLRDAGDVLGVTRWPSNTTIQKAIDRAQRMTRSATDPDEHPGAAPLDLHAMRRALEPLVHDAIAPLLEQLVQRPAPPGPSASAPLPQS